VSLCAEGADPEAVGSAASVHFLQLPTAVTDVDPAAAELVRECLVGWPRYPASRGVVGPVFSRFEFQQRPSSFFFVTFSYSFLAVIGVGGDGRSADGR
jgi:hypothetical protein